MEKEFLSMKKFTVFMILILLLIPAATAATVTISPTKIDPGDTVSVREGSS